MHEISEDVAEWLAIRKEQAKLIDPKTAEVMRTFGNILDPYCNDNLYIARAPDSDVWVSFDDLPEATRDALWEKCRLALYYDNELPPF
jgi:hypothetical protein